MEHFRCEPFSSPFVALDLRFHSWPGVTTLRVQISKKRSVWLCIAGVGFDTKFVPRLIEDVFSRIYVWAAFIQQFLRLHRCNWRICKLTLMLHFSAIKTANRIESHYTKHNTLQRVQRHHTPEANTLARLRNTVDIGRQNRRKKMSI